MASSRVEPQGSITTSFFYVCLDCLDNPPVRAINRIVTSLGATTEIEYRPVSYQFVQNETFGREDEDIEECYRDLTPILPYNGYLSIVEKVKTEMNDSNATGINTAKTFRTTRYHFSRPYYHTRGRGFLGFSWVWSRRQGVNEVDDIITKNYYILNQTYSILVPDKIISSHFNYNPTVSYKTHEETDFTYQYHTNADFNNALGQIPDDVFSPYLQQSVTQKDDGSPIYFEKEVFQKDSYGNVTSYNHYYGTNANNFPFYEHSVTTYENNIGPSRWIIGVPKTETLTRHLFGNATNTIARHITYQNDMGIGLHIVKCIEPGHEKQLTETNTYDRFGNLVSTTTTGSGETRTESMAYSADGRFPIAKTNALQQTTTYTFDEATGKIESITDPNGLTTRYRYDILGNLIQTEYPSGVLEDQSMMWVDNSLSKNYHPDTPNFGCPVYFTYSKRSGEKESYVFYDQHNRKLREVNCNMAGEKIYVDYRYYEYSGLLNSVSPPYFPSREFPQFTNYGFDYLGRNTAIIRYDHSSLNHIYNGTYETIINYDGQKTILYYNKAGLVVQAYRFKGNTNNVVLTDFTYYGDGKVKTVGPQAENSLEITYDYDIHRNPISVIDPSLGELTYTYNAFGELEASSTPRNESHYVYDALGRMIQRRNDDGDSYWVYDNGFIGALSNTIYVPINGPTVIEHYRYDRQGHLIRQTQKVGNEGTWGFDYTYNSLGKQSSITYPSGKKIKYHYNSKGFMDHVKDAATGNVVWEANASDRWDNISSFTEGDIQVTYKNDAVTGLVHRISALRNEQTLLSQRYEWTNTGNLIYRTDASLDLKETFDYDGYNRLVSSVVKTMMRRKPIPSNTIATTTAEESHKKQVLAAIRMAPTPTRMP